MGTNTIKIHIYDTKKHKTYNDAKSENAIYNYDASHCDDNLAGGFGGGLIYETMHAMSLVLGMVGQGDRLGAVLLVNGKVVDTYGEEDNVSFSEINHETYEIAAEILELFNDGGRRQ